MTAAPANPAQERAIAHPLDRPLKVAAGPGTGKTHVLAERYLHLLTGHRLQPREILAITFTNRAAAEMRERVARYGIQSGALPRALDLADAWIGTFHGICLRLVQEQPLAIGLHTSIAVLDEVERRRLRARVRRRLLDGALCGPDWRPDGALLLDLVADEFWRGVWATVDRLQDLLVAPDCFAAQALARAHGRQPAVEAALAGPLSPKDRDRALRARDDYAALPGLARVVEILYRAYQEELQRRGALDFPGQIMAAYRLLAENPAIQARYRAQFHHILVDEVQDTSGAQMKLVAALAAPGLANVTVIGDRKQSIYGWRGARPENLEEIDPAGGGGAGIGLGTNYRSFQEILDVARHALLPLAMAGRVDPDELDLVAHGGAAGGPVVTVAGPADDAVVGEGRRREAQYVAARVTALLAPAGAEQPCYRGEDIVVLMRSVAAAGIYEEALRAQGIPTLVIGGRGFFGRPEVRDALALLRAAVDPLDDIALVRTMQGPLCGLSDPAVGAIARHAGHGHLYDGLVRVETLPFSVPERDEVVRRAAALVALLERVGRRLEGLPLPDLLQGALEEGGYLDYARTRPDTERERVRANLEKVRRSARVYAQAHPLATAAAYARQLSYMFDEEIDEAEESVDAGPDVVRIMTVHQAKGLEFPVVIVANATPYAHRLDEPAITYDEGEGFLVLKRADVSGKMREGADLAGFKARQETRTLEEERYVWYVALTRAKNRLILTTPRPLDKPVWKNQQWPLQELYTALTSDNPPADIAAAVALETLDDLPEAQLAPLPLPSLEDALERVRSAARLAAREEPAPAAASPGPVTLSYSALRTYRACPRRYQLAHVLRLPEVPAALLPPPAGADCCDAAALGAAVHAALERYPDSGATRDQLVAALVESCHAQGIAEEEIEAVYRPRGERMLDLYLRRVVGAGQVQRVYAELAVRHLVRGGPIPVTFVGRIDRVDLDAAGWRLIDYKTHRALEAETLDEAALQLRLYKVAWQAGAAAAVGAGGSPDGAPRLYVYEAQTGVLREVPGGPRALDAAVNLLCDVAGKIAAGDFAVPPGYDPPCATCPFGGPYGLCPDRRNRDDGGDPDRALAGEVYGARRYDHGSAPGQYPMLGPNGLDEDQGPIPGLAAAGDAAPSPPCFLCGPGERCARSRLEGTLRDVQLAREQHGGRARALLAVEGRETWLELAPPWQSLAPTLQDVLAAGHRVRLAAYHLARGGAAPGERPSYRATETSLVALDPDTLVDVTAVADAGYCTRKALVEGLARRGTAAAMAEGSAVHVAFARGLLRGEPPLAHLDDALRGAAAGLALARDGDGGAGARERAADHLTRVGAWLDAQQPPGGVRAEALLLSPALGLRGRMDAIVDPDGRPVVLDLKTGTSDGPDPRPPHAVQMATYDLLLREKGRHPAPGWLLYSGNPAGDVGRRVAAGHVEHVRVMRLRNELAAIGLLGRAPLSPYRARCLRCDAIAGCRTLSFLNGEPAYALDAGAEEVRERLSDEDARFFRHYSALLRLEGRAAAASVQNLWRLVAGARVARGDAADVAGVTRTVEPLDGGEEAWRFSCDNRSNLREGDVVLVSDGDPVAGEAEQGLVERSTAEELLVRVRGRMAAEPRLVDRYAVDSAWQRGLRTLWAWMGRSRHLHRLVDRTALPRFRSPDDDDRAAAGANPGQRRAIALALAAEDYLLVQGPPGAGKTVTIARMVRALRERGERVVLASFTNRAVDTMIGALNAEDLRHVVRLGSEAATSEHLRFTTLARRMAAAGAAAPLSAAGRSAALLDGAGLVAGTAAALAAAVYDAQRFDVAIVDEASQLTVPDVLAALRLARRFVLVGDDRQLPPVVQSSEAAAMEEGLATTLFTLLRDHLERAGAEGLVMLEDQYRMNTAICAFPSREWYEGRLRPGTEAVARGRLPLDLAAVPVDRRAVLDPDRPVVFVDVSADSGGRPRTSDAEAQTVCALCVGLTAGGVQPQAIGVVAPYRAQVALIRNMLRAAGLGGVTVDTVDRFQGSERAAMILSLVGGSGQIGHLLQDERRLNVALTRARHKLVLVGDGRELRADPLYARLLDAVAGELSEEEA